LLFVESEMSGFIEEESRLSKWIPNKSNNPVYVIVKRELLWDDVFIDLFVYVLVKSYSFD
jgi:hypothetical protein